jgi:Domain of unknown function (DUF6378)
VSRPLTREQLKEKITAATRTTIAEEATTLVAGARRDHYGDPVENHTRIGKVWAVLLDLPEPISPRTVAVMMAALKLVREGGPRGKRDNLVDACGYLLIAEQATPHPD